MRAERGYRAGRDLEREGGREGARPKYDHYLQPCRDYTAGVQTAFFVRVRALRELRSVLERGGL